MRCASSKRPFGLLKAFALALAAAGCSGGSEYKPYPPGDSARTWKLGGVETTIEVADNRAEREKGLMYRTSMPEDHGMLFVYPEPQLLRFWMKNTAIPLSIAFLVEDAEGKKATIANIEDMQPYTELPGAVSQGKVRFALEMNQGWFKKHGLKGGDTVELASWINGIVASGDEVGGG
jgi:uncharacterized membrane protein (UPF0127 family)